MSLFTKRMINGNAKKISAPQRIKHNGSEVQSVIFNADTYTDKQARILLKKWKLKPMPTRSRSKSNRIKKKSKIEILNAKIKILNAKIKKKRSRDTERDDLLIYVNGFKKGKKGISPKRVGRVDHDQSRENGILRYIINNPKKYVSFSTKRTKYDISFIIGFLPVGDSDHNGATDQTQLEDLIKQKKNILQNNNNLI